MSLGKEIRKARIDHDLPQHELAKAVGLSNKHLSQIECGHVDPSFSVVQRIARVLAVSLDQLGEHAVPRPPAPVTADW